MSKLAELLKEIKDENLTKESLDQYYSALSLLRGDVRIELAGIQKEKAMFMLEDAEKSVAQRKINWQAGEKGQREIDLKAYISSMGDALGSVKTRIYALL